MRLELEEIKNDFESERVPYPRIVIRLLICIANILIHIYQDK